MLDKIKYSKKGFEATDLFFKTCKKFPLVMAWNLFFPVIGLLSKNRLLLIVSLYGMGTIAAATVILSKISKNKIIQESYLGLEKLTNLLAKLEIRTTAELLKESKILKKDLEFKFVDSKPVILERKYIDVPLVNDYNETLLQEHIIGSNKWEISVDEPEKKVSYKLAKLHG